MSDMAKEHLVRKDRFLSAVPEVLCSYNWSEQMLSIVNESCGFKKGYYHILFPEEITEVIAEYENWQNQQMLAIAGKEKNLKKVREKIARALEIRITGIMPKQAALNHSSYFLLPANIFSGLEYAVITCDRIWRFAGDKSTDFNYYTKRGLLLPVYLAAQTYYFADKSEGHVDTKEFIKSSLDNIINIANLKNQINLPKMEDIPILRLFS